MPMLLIHYLYLAHHVYRNSILITLTCSVWTSRVDSRTDGRRVESRRWRWYYDFDNIFLPLPTCTCVAVITVVVVISQEDPSLKELSLSYLFFGHNIYVPRLKDFASLRWLGLLNLEKEINGFEIDVSLNVSFAALRSGPDLKSLSVI